VTARRYLQSLVTAGAIAALSVGAHAQPEDDAVVSPETLDALDDLDRVSVPDDDTKKGPSTTPPPAGLTKLSIDQLASIKVKVASGLSESLTNAPGSIVVITALDIRQRGYTSIDEVFDDLPGFDVVRARGTSYATVYQRGYRTPFTQRILFLVDGQVDNHLWSHEADLTRQYPLSNIERIEVLYGPASAVYGPNAFSGIVNVVTRDGKGLRSGGVTQEVNLQLGSWRTRSVDAAVRGRSGDWSFAVSARIFASREPDLSDRFGFVSNDLYSDRNVWGPLLDTEIADESLGKYLDRTDDRGLLASVSYKDTKLGVIWWRRAESFGPYYAADRVQNNAFWVRTSAQAYLTHRSALSDKISARTLILVRDNTTTGDWAEAIPDNEAAVNADPNLDYTDLSQTSYISKTMWYAGGQSLLARQMIEGKVDQHLALSGGLKYERKKLAKQYDVPGYYLGGYSSAGTQDDPGPYGLGSHVGHSTDTSYTEPPQPVGTLADDNVVLTDDIGGFVQAIYDRGRFRLSSGLRLDHNSVYGGTFNPRITGIARLGKRGAVKVLYGEAFQEPPPIQLWGGWSGRLSNADLRPEKVRNLEGVFVYRAGRTLHQVSAFYAHYNDVIKEESRNLGRRDITGVEYSARFTMPSPIPGADDLNGYANASFTMGWGEQSYDHALGQWVKETSRLGDIAPFKANIGLTAPLPRGFLAHLRANFVSERTVYSRNPLRDESRSDGGRTIDPYVVFNANVSYRRGPVTLSVKGLNLLGSEYMHPGVESASAGDDFTHRSRGFHNSLLPQPGRSVFATLTLTTQ
jgi:iron complex outermembrane receptor protein